MTSFGNFHLTDKELLLYADGEMAGKERNHVRAHLEACWSCRARLDDLHSTIKEIVEFRNHVLLPMVPTPPKHWDGLDPRLSELEKTIGGKSVTQWVGDLLRSGALTPRYAVFATFVLLVLGGLIWLPSQPLVSANEFLARTQAAQSGELKTVASPVVHQRLRVRRKVTGSSREASADYDCWKDHSHGRFRQTGSSEEVLAELQHVYQTNGLDWQAPLSAVVYARWREALPAKQDFVIQDYSATHVDSDRGPELLALTTSAGSEAGKKSRRAMLEGDRITKAQLVVRAADWHPVEERFWLSDREYEIAEVQYRVLPLSQVEASIFAEPPAPAKPAEAPRPLLTAKSEPPTPDPAETEMAVRYNLHQLNADLGEPIEISQRPQGKVVVRAINVAPELQAKLEKQLASIPNISVKVGDGTPACGAGCASSTPPPLIVIPAVNPNEKRLEEIFGDAQAEESFTQEVLVVSGDALSRAFALRALAFRYPPEKEAGLTPNAKTQLREMLDDHVAALSEHSIRLQGLLRPLLEALSKKELSESGAQNAVSGGAVPQSGSPAPGDQRLARLAGGWQSTTLELFAASQKTDRMVKSLLTRTNAVIPAEEAVPELRRALAEQQKDLERYRILLEQ